MAKNSFVAEINFNLPTNVPYFSEFVYQSSFTDRWFIEISLVCTRTLYKKDNYLYFLLLYRACNTA